MSVLKKYQGKKFNITGYLGARVSAELERNFKEHCDKLGIEVSDALRLLIENELGQKTAPAAPRDQQEIHFYSAENAPPGLFVPPVESLPAAAQEKPKNENKSSGRFTVKQWERDKLLPCPLCKEWKSAANFSRHAKTEHNTTTKELLSHSSAAADEMAAEYDNKKSQGV